MSGETFVHYYRAHDLNDPNLFFFTIRAWRDSTTPRYKITYVGTINDSNGNLDDYDEDWNFLIAMTFTDVVEEISKEQFNEVRKEYIK